MSVWKSHTPEDIEQARTLYEGTEVSPHDIARLLGLGTNTFYRRVNRWGWRRRRYRVEEVDALARQAAALRGADPGLAAFAARVEQDRRSSVERARDAIHGAFAAMEATQMRVAEAAISAIEGERSAKALLALSRALVEIDRLERDRSAARAADPAPVDADAMRLELARRLAALRASVAAEDAGAAGR